MLRAAGDSRLRGNDTNMQHFRCGPDKGDRIVVLGTAWGRYLTVIFFSVSNSPSLSVTQRNLTVPLSGTFSVNSI